MVHVDAVVGGDAEEVLRVGGQAQTDGPLQAAHRQNERRPRVRQPRGQRNEERQAVGVAPFHALLDEPSDVSGIDSWMVGAHITRAS